MEFTGFILQGLQALFYNLQFTVFFFTFTNAIRTGNLFNLYYTIYHYTISISICEKLKVFFNLTGWIKVII